MVLRFLTVFFTLTFTSVIKISLCDEASDYPCKLVQDGLVYDLSQLGARDYWHFIETLHEEHIKEYYLSVCHPLRNVPVSCPPGNTGVCSVTIPDNSSSPRQFQNLGLIPSSITVGDVGRLVYEYENGEKCSKTGQDISYKTELHLLCPPGGGDDSEPVPMTSTGCNLFFAWMTKAACPKKLETSNVTTCTAKFSNSDHVLNLHSLHSSTYYNVSGDHGDQYEMNICGPVTDGHCGRDDATICKINTTSNSSSSSVVMGTTKDMKLIFSDNLFKLIYVYGNKTMEIQLFCDREAHNPQIYYYGNKNETTEIFSVRTAVVCTPSSAPECIVTDDNENVYDLRPLHKEKGNWKVLDSRKDQKILYHINMCGEVNDEHFYHCPLGPVGACQTGVGPSSSYNLGFMTSNPTVNKDGSITVVYTGGDKCKDGKHARSTRINLVCDAVEREPVMEEVTETCEYIFHWQTPAACPRHKKTGDDCTVTDPLYGNLYDFTSLRNKDKDYNSSDGVHNYFLNICGPLISKCNGEDTSGVCQVKGDDQYSGGLASSSLTFNDGSLVMKFENGSGGCKDGAARSSHIIFMCDHSESGYNGPVFIQEDHDSCSYYFIWRTRIACPAFQVVDCSYTMKNGTIFDLSELSTPNMNEEYYPSDHKTKYILNVCRSVVHSKDSRCPYKAGACIIDLENKNHALSIGEVSSGPTFEDGKLKLKYVRGDACKQNDSMQAETIIEFKCDKEALYPYPQLIAVENCKYIFEWPTPVACPVTSSSMTTTGVKAGTNCLVTNPVTGYEFDLNPLKNSTGYEVWGDNDLHLTLNVCDMVNKDNCPSGDAGACSHTHSAKDVTIAGHSAENITNAGKANDELQFLPGFLYLHYDGGDSCPNGLTRSTLINFICGAKGSQEGPVLINDDGDNCMYHINWHTELACERRIDCFVDTYKRRIDLSPLIRTSGNYEVDNPQDRKQKFYLNVCRPLNHIVGVLCHPGSSACLVNSSVASSPLNLGHPKVTPVNAYDTGIQLMYSAGSVCPFNEGLPVTSMISFICDKDASMGSPIFKELTSDCQYKFEWKTSLVCEESDEVPDTGPVCQIMYEAAKTNVDLKPLHRAEGYEVTYKNTTFTISVCGPSCGNYGVCTSNGESYGLLKKSHLKWDYDKLKLTYYDGDECDGSVSGNRTSAIYFQCDMKAGYGTPVPDDIMQDLECMAIFTWKTNLTCMEGIYGTKDTSNNVPASSTTADPSAETHKSEEESSHSPVAGVVATVLVVSGIIFVIILVLFKSQRGQRVMASARRLFGITGYTDLNQRPAESSTLLGPTSRVFRVDDSDDDLLRV